MEKTYAVYMPAIGEPEIVEFKAKEEGLGYYYRTIDCGTIDIVHTVLEGKCLVVDDEGLFKEEPAVNMPASLLYGFLEHGQPIVGNALLCKDSYTPEGTETVGLSHDEALAVLEIFGLNAQD